MVSAALFALSAAVCANVAFLLASFAASVAAVVAVLALEIACKVLLVASFAASVAAIVSFLAVKVSCLTWSVSFFTLVVSEIIWLVFCSLASSFCSLMASWDCLSSSDCLDSCSNSLKSEVAWLAASAAALASLAASLLSLLKDSSHSSSVPSNPCCTAIWYAESPVTPVAPDKSVMNFQDSSAFIYSLEFSGSSISSVFMTTNSPTSTSGLLKLSSISWTEE